MLLIPGSVWPLFVNVVVHLRWTRDMGKIITSCPDTASFVLIASSRSIIFTNSGGDHCILSIRPPAMRQDAGRWRTPRLLPIHNKILLSLPQDDRNRVISTMEFVRCRCVRFPRTWRTTKQNCEHVADLCYSCGGGVYGLAAYYFSAASEASPRSCRALGSVWVF
jgi:hypothetical protein